MLDLRANPFFLDEAGIAWVEDTLASLSLREKVGQMFCIVSNQESLDTLLRRYAVIPFGGMTYRAAPSETLRETTEALQHAVKIPLLISANLENGGSGVASDGTEYASQLETAATGDLRYAETLGDICGSEGMSVGVNCSFSPVVDVHFNWRNAIINTRTFGSDPEYVLSCAKAYLRGLGRHGVAATIKHFPGDGVDERDQHLLTSVNSLSCEDWDASFGRIYGELIQAGVQSVMVGHILQPAYSRKLCPGIADKDIRPASLSPELLQGLLREKLGFQGVIITDSAVMTGMRCALPCREIPAAAVNAGCDMFLFGRNLQEDFENLLADAESGKVPLRRIDDAVRRILAMKASLGLHRAQRFTSEENTVGCPRHRQLARECAERAITLVKDTQSLLPISPEKHRRVWLHVLGDDAGFRGGYPCKEEMVWALTEQGFAVTCFSPEQLTNPRVTELKEQYDLILYVANVVTGANRTVNRISWDKTACGESPQYVKDIPTLFVSLGDPYHFVDVPMIPTFINCYAHSPEMISALMDKLLGRSPFTGVSPVDPFCGMWGAAL